MAHKFEPKKGIEQSDFANDFFGPAPVADRDGNVDGVDLTPRTLDIPELPGEFNRLRMVVPVSGHYAIVAAEIDKENK